MAARRIFLSEVVETEHDDCLIVRCADGYEFVVRVELLAPRKHRSEPAE